MKNSGLKEKMDQLGNDLNIDIAWEEFYVNKRKRRFAFYWLAGVLGVMAISIAYNYYNREDFDLSQDYQPFQLEERATLMHDDLAEAPKIESTSLHQEEYPNIEKSKKPGQAEDQLRGSLSHEQFNEEYSSSITVTSNGSITPILQSGKLKKGHQVVRVSDNVADVENIKSSEGLKSIGHPSRDMALQPLEVVGLVPINIKKLEYSMTAPDMTIDRVAAITPKTSDPSWYLSMSFDLGNMSRSIQGDVSSFNERRLLSEAPQEQSRLNLKLSKYVTSKLYMSGGLSVGQYRTRMEDRFTTFRSTVIEDAVIEIIKTNSVAKEVRGPATATLIEKNVAVRYQRYLDISLPFSIGYHMPLDDQWGVDLSVGALLSIYNMNKGEIHESYFSLGSYSDLSSMYRESGQMQLSGGVMITRSINDQMRWLFGAQYHNDVNNRIRDSQGTSDRFSGIGVRFGISKAL